MSLFKLKPDATFSWPVAAKVPADGKFQTVKFNAVFNVLPSEKIQSLIRGNDDDVESGSMAVLKAALVSFSDIDVEDEDGNPVTDDEERNAILLRYPYMVSALSDAYAGGVAGYKAKN